MKEGQLTKWLIAIVLILPGVPLQLAAQESRALSIAKNQIGATTNTCCAPTNGFSITSVFLAPTEDDIPCFNCAPGVTARHMVIPIPHREVRVGGDWSTTVLIHSAIPGPCTVTVTWLSLTSNEIIFGPFTARGFDDCENLFGSIEILTRDVPNVPGNAAVMVTGHAGDGRQVVEWEFFEIR